MDRRTKLIKQNAIYGKYTLNEISRRILYTDTE